MIRVFFGAFVLVAALAPGPAAACSCLPPSTIEAAGRVDAIVEGPLVSVGPAEGGSIDAQPIRIRVDAVYKAHPAATVGGELPATYTLCNSSPLVVGGARIWFLSERDGVLGTHACSASAAANPAGRAHVREALLLAEALGPARTDDTQDPKTPAFIAPALALGWRLGVLERTARLAEPDHTPTPELLRVHDALTGVFGVRMYPPAGSPAAAVAHDRSTFAYVTERVGLRNRGGIHLVLGRQLQYWWTEDPAADPPRDRRRSPLSLARHAGMDVAALTALLDRYTPRRGEDGAAVAFLREVCALTAGRGCATVPFDEMLLD